MTKASAREFVELISISEPESLSKETVVAPCSPDGKRQSTALGGSFPWLDFGLRPLSEKDEIYEYVCGSIQGALMYFSQFGWELAATAHCGNRDGFEVTRYLLSRSKQLEIGVWANPARYFRTNGIFLHVSESEGECRAYLDSKDSKYSAPMVYEGSEPPGNFVWSENGSFIDGKGSTLQNALQDLSQKLQGRVIYCGRPLNFLRLPLGFELTGSGDYGLDFQRK